MFQRKNSHEQSALETLYANRLRVRIYMHPCGHQNQENQPTRIILLTSHATISFTLTCDKDKSCSNQYLIFRAGEKVQTDIAPNYSFSFYKLDLATNDLMSKFNALTAKGNMVLIKGSDNGEKILLEYVYDFLNACRLEEFLIPPPSFLSSTRSNQDAPIKMSLFLNLLENCINQERDKYPETATLHSSHTKSAEQCKIQ